MAKSTIVSFVSGKGGVGKTMLAVSFAKELSESNNVLIVDLDFFNRGLTGLMSKGEKICTLEQPGFLTDKTRRESKEWSIDKVSDRLYHVRFPDIHSRDFQKLEAYSVHELKDLLLDFVENAAEQCGCDSIVLDCHGGPDRTSFAACLISDHTLLVSEPDKVTFYGTLNFVRQLKRESAGADYNVHLVFNKVVESFSSRFLKRFYKNQVQSIFKGNDLLAIYPLEVYLTKEFEKATFLTAVYPKSLLARKTKVLISDLLSEKRPELISEEVKSIPSILKYAWRNMMGKAFPILDLNVIMASIFIGVCLFAGIFLAFESDWYITAKEETSNARERISVVAVDKMAPELFENQEALQQYYDGDITLDTCINLQMGDFYEEYLERMNRDRSELIEAGLYYVNEYNGDTITVVYQDPLVEEFEMAKGEFTYYMAELWEGLAYEVQEDQLEEVYEESDYGDEDLPEEDYEEPYYKDEELLEEIYEESDYGGEEYTLYSNNDPLFFTLPEVIEMFETPQNKALIDQFLKKANKLYPVDVIEEGMNKLLDNAVLYVILLLWFGLGLFVKWNTHLERQFTYLAKLNMNMKSFIMLLGKMFVWLFPLMLFMVSIQNMGFRSDSNFIVYVGVALFLVLILEQAVIVYRDLRFNKAYVESAFRVLFILYVMIWPLLGVSGL